MGEKPKRNWREYNDKRQLDDGFAKRSTLGCSPWLAGILSSLNSKESLKRPDTSKK